MRVGVLTVSDGCYHGQRKDRSGDLITQWCQESGYQVAVRDIMNPDPITATPDLPTVRAIARMRERKVSCLPVVDGDRRLVGIVSERDFIHLTANLLDAILREADDDANGS